MGLQILQSRWRNWQKREETLNGMMTLITASVLSYPMTKMRFVLNTDATPAMSKKALFCLKLKMHKKRSLVTLVKSAQVTNTFTNTCMAWSCRATMASAVYKSRRPNIWKSCRNMISRRNIKLVVVIVMLQKFRRTRKRPGQPIWEKIVRYNPTAHSGIYWESKMVS